MSEVISVEEQHQKLIQFIYQTPVGIIEFDQAGSVKLMNAVASRDLFPINPDCGNENIFTTLEAVVPNLEQRVMAFEDDHGSIISNEPFRVDSGDEGRRYYSFSVEKLQSDVFMDILNDITDYIHKEQEVVRAREERAKAQGKSQIAGEFLHDIGNAITSASTTINRLFTEEDWREIQSLANLTWPAA